LVNSRTHNGGNLCHVGRTALTPFNLDSSDAYPFEFRQDGQGIETGRFFKGIKGIVADPEPTFAQGRITRFFTFTIVVDQDAV